MKEVQADVAPLSVQSGQLSGTSFLDLFALTKPRLNLLVVATSAAGYYMGAAGTVAVLPMFRAVVGTALVAAGAATLNQLYERDTDALMGRTRLRPLPGGRVSPHDALIFGAILAASGLLALAFANVLATVLALTTLVVYLGIYTPMKRRSPGATLVGAVPGALPPLIGWAASTGSASFGGWTLFAIVFLWQIPHFMAIAWMFREDYRKAGFPMLPVVEPSGARAGRQALMYSAALLPASLLPTATGVSGWGYFWAALVLGVAMVVLAARFSSRRTDTSARALFYGSITYLPLIWIAMILDLS